MNAWGVSYRKMCRRVCHMPKKMPRVPWAINTVTPGPMLGIGYFLNFGIRVSLHE